MKEWSVNLELEGRFTQDQAEDLIDRLGDRAAAAVSVSPKRLSIRFYVEAAFAHTAIERATEEIQKLLGESTFTVASAEAQTPEELDRALERPNFPDLLGVTEVARLLRVSRQRVDEIARTHENFPKPAVQLAAGPIWERAAIERFVEEWPRRAGRPPKSDLRRRIPAMAAMLDAGEMEVVNVGEESGTGRVDAKRKIEAITRHNLEAIKRHNAENLGETAAHLQGQIVAGPIHTFPQATRFMTALSQLPGIYSIKLRSYSGAKVTTDVVTEGRSVGTIDYSRMDDFPIEVVESSENQVVLRVISGTGAAARR